MSIFKHLLELGRDKRAPTSGKHALITDEILEKAARSGDKFYVMSTNPGRGGYLSPDGSHSVGEEDLESWFAKKVNPMDMAYQWPGEDLPYASILEGYVLRKVRNQPDEASRKPLHFDPRQFRDFPFRPRPFFKHDYVLLMTPWFGIGVYHGTCWHLQGDKGEHNHTHSVQEATKLSVEQAAYLMHHGTGAAASGMPVLYETALAQPEPPYKFVDVRRLPESPNRMRWFRNPYKGTEVKTKRHSKYVQRAFTYKDTRSYRHRILDHILGRKLYNPHKPTPERIT